MMFLHERVHFVSDIYVLNCWRNLVFLFIAHLSDNVTQILSRTSFGKTGDDMTGLETCHRTDVFANQLYAFFCHCFWRVAVSVFWLDGDEGDRNFSLDFILDTDDDGLSYFVMLHQNLLHLPCWQPVSCGIDNIIFSGHYVEVAILIIVSRISSIVVSHQGWEIFFQEYIVVIEDCWHEWGRHGLSYIHSSCLIWPALHSSCRINHFYVVARERLARRAWFLRKGLES